MNFRLISYAINGRGKNNNKHFLQQKHHSESKFQSTVPHIVFDYHQECRGGNIGALSKLGARIAQFAKDISIYYVNDKNIQRYYL